MKYKLERNGELIKHVIMVGNGDKNLYREREVVHLEFENFVKAQEAATALMANIVTEDELKKAA